jgi:carbon-monoxide dehydrogenase medium subunit
VSEALEILAAHTETARVLAGGQSLVPLLNLRLIEVEQLIDLNRIPGLSYIQEGDGSLLMGAMTRQATVEVSYEARATCPLLVDATRYVGTWQIRNRGTVGGSIAHADPSAEIPMVWLTLGGSLTVSSAGGITRTLEAEDYFTTYFTSTLRRGEILTEVRFPKLPPASGWSFQEIARRPGAPAILSIAVLIKLDEGVIQEARIGLGGVGERPVRAIQAEEFLLLRPPAEETVSRGAALVAKEIRPPDDHRASGGYRRHVAEVLFRRALAQCFQRAGAHRDTRKRLWGRAGDWESGWS